MKCRKPRSGSALFHTGVLDLHLPGFQCHQDKNVNDGQHDDGQEFQIATHFHNTECDDHQQGTEYANTRNDDLHMLAPLFLQAIWRMLVAVDPIMSNGATLSANFPMTGNAS
ncbi:MAG: hypothetical protein LLG97_17190 [Deltaproteobacteria bacterium]|nr:hypothetical protein [Deltaproteobacteria bacterium]